MIYQRVATLAIALLAFAASTTDARNLRRLGATYSADSNDWKQAMLDAVNMQRANNGLSALCLNSRLISAAQGHSDDMAKNNYMDHDGADGSTMSSRVTAAGYDWTYVEENVAAGQVDVDAVMESWMNSEGHRANILSADVTMFGCGYAYNDDTEFGHYWTQDFGDSSVDECDSGSAAKTDSTASTTQTDDVAGEADVNTSTEAPSAYENETEAPVTEAPTESSATDSPYSYETEPPTTESPETEVPATEAPVSGGCKVYSG